MHTLKLWTLLLLRLWIGYTFVVEGLEKFEPLPDRPGPLSEFMQFYTALSNTGYLLPLLGIAEMAGGLLLISQRYSFLGAVLLMPVMINVLLAHALLIQSPSGISLTAGLQLGLLVLLFSDGASARSLLKPHFNYRQWAAQLRGRQPSA